MIRGCGMGSNYRLIYKMCCCKGQGQTMTNHNTQAAHWPLQYVDPAYRHYPKLVTPQATFHLPRAHFKWYDLARADAPVPAEIQRLARDFLSVEANAGQLGLDNELGFVILHRCNNDFYFLLVSTWRSSNELWESIYYKENAAMPGFALFPREERHKGTYCVWELGAVWHEQQAWVRLLNSARGEESQLAYLSDHFSGAVLNALPGSQMVSKTVGQSQLTVLLS